MLRLLLMALALTLLAGSAPAANEKAARNARIQAARQRAKRAGKQAKRRAKQAQKQANWQLKERNKQIQRSQADTVQARDQSFAKQRKRRLKDRQDVASRHKAVHVLDAPPPDPKPDSTPKAKTRGMSGSALAPEQ